MSEDQPKPSSYPLMIHRINVAIVYIVAFVAVGFLFRVSTDTTVVGVVSLGAMVATFGSAIIALGALFTHDKLERVKQNVSILYNDILKTEPWKRWPFLKRKTSMRLLSADIIRTNLRNPEMPFDVGSHTFSVTIPTVLEDFFDLPLLRNFVPLVRFRNAFFTTHARKTSESSEGTPYDPEGTTFMAYQCVEDIWSAVFVFRIARYVTHLGCALVISSALFVAYDCITIVPRP